MRGGAGAAAAAAAFRASGAESGQAEEIRDVLVLEIDVDPGLDALGLLDVLDAGADSEQRVQPHHASEIVLRMREVMAVDRAVAAEIVRLAEDGEPPQDGMVGERRQGQPGAARGAQDSDSKIGIAPVPAQ